MHADEAILADKLGTLLATGAYPYDPQDYHGPILARLAWIPARLTGRTTYSALTEATLRSVPAVAGIALALSALLLAPVIGGTAALWAAAIVAVSPAMVYFSRYFIPEMPLALWTALLLAAMMRGWWTFAGIAAALTIATKETAILALVCAAVAYAAVYRPRMNYRTVAVFAAGLIVGISVFLGTPWQWGAIAQAASVYWERGTAGGGHAHPWYMYFRWLSITEAPIVLGAVVGLAVAWRSGSQALRFLACYTVLLAGLYSAIPYKTPWCAVSVLYGLAILGGVAVKELRGLRRIVAAAVLLFVGAGAWLMSVRYASDPRNPWVYAHTGPGVYTIRDRVLAFARSEPQVAIDVYSAENLWPLPWYFRQFPNIRWWRQVAISGSAAPIVLVSPALEPDLARKLYEGPPPGERELYMNMFEGYVELRPQIEVRGYVAKSLWDRAP